MIGGSPVGAHDGTEGGSPHSRDSAHIADWVAKVLEIRAMDKFHVYLRVFWMYRQADLPDRHSSQMEHNELIASNHSEDPI